MAAIQFAKHAGATVISTGSSDKKLERLAEFGLDHGINYASENFVERTRKLTDGRGADVILDSVGGQNLVDSIGALAYRGSLVSVGVAARASAPGTSSAPRFNWPTTRVPDARSPIHPGKP
jgi:NADPH2:quinone reductase